MVYAPRPTFQQPLKVVCVDGEVVITGPEHLHGAFSVEAARQSVAILEEIVERAHAEAAKDPDPS